MRWGTNFLEGHAASIFRLKMDDMNLHSRENLISQVLLLFYMRYITVLKKNFTDEKYFRNG
jgi:hypothetical protein